MAKQEFSIPALNKRLRTDADAYELLEDLRWHGQPVCPHCGSLGKHYFLKPANGTDRRTRTGTRSERRVWKCRDCRKQFTVLVGTIFHGTKIPLRTWLLVILDMCASKNGISAREVERKYDLTPKSAWFLCHRIREAMKLDPMAGLLSGTIQADETWIGGDPKNRHRSDPREIGRREDGRRYGPTDKQPVFSLIHYETREVRSKVVPDVTGATLLPVMDEHTDLPNVWLQTDGSRSYDVVAKHTYDHSFVDHSSGQYVNRDGAGSNFVEGFFSQLKRSLDGTFHHVSVEHLPRYLAQFDFLYSNCRMDDSARLRLLVGQTGGRRLTYRPLVTAR